jgi:hypothetical protein
MDKKYTLQELFNMGLISYKPLFYLEMVNKYQQLRAAKVKKSVAVKQVAELSRVTPKTVYQAIRLLTR